MSTTEYGKSIRIAGRLVGATGLIAALAKLAASTTTVTKTVWRTLANRIAVSPLYEMDSHQLDDIGLTRHDVLKALDHSGMLDDPAKLLTLSVRERGRHRFRRKGLR